MTVTNQYKIEYHLFVTLPFFLGLPVLGLLLRSSLFLLWCVNC